MERVRATVVRPSRRSTHGARPAPRSRHLPGGALPHLRFRRDEDGSLHRFGSIPLTTTGRLGDRPFVLTFRGDLARFRVWPTGTQTPPHAGHWPSGFPLLEIHRDNVTGDKLSSYLTTIQLVHLFTLFLDDAQPHLVRETDALTPVALTLPAKLVDPDQVTGLLAPFWTKDGPIQELLLDCSGLTGFSQEAIGRLDERTTGLFNVTTLVGASPEFSAAYSDEALPEAIRQMKLDRMRRRRAEREQLRG